jgi:hypothetical protein
MDWKPAVSRNPMTKTQVKKLKEIDAQILQFGVYIQALVKDRAAIDRDSTMQFLDVFSQGLKKIAEKRWPLKQLSTWMSIWFFKKFERLVTGGAVKQPQHAFAPSQYANSWCEGSGLTSENRAANPTLVEWKKLRCRGKGWGVT